MGYIHNFQLELSPQLIIFFHECALFYVLIVKEMACIIQQNREEHEQLLFQQLRVNRLMVENKWEETYLAPAERSELRIKQVL